MNMLCTSKEGRGVFRLFQKLFDAADSNEVLERMDTDLNTLLRIKGLRDGSEEQWNLIKLNKDRIINHYISIYNEYIRRSYFKYAEEAIKNEDGDIALSIFRKLTSGQQELLLKGEIDELIQTLTQQ